MEIFFSIVIAVYITLHLIIYAGLNKSRLLKKINDKEFPFVTLIVAARNEERIIAECIASLKTLQYEQNRFEIFLVNDKSTDRTKEIMLEETGDFPQFRVIDSRPAEGGNLIGKANAIDTAIKQAKGEIIFTTDADCTIREKWLYETVKYFDDDTALVCGFTNIDYSGSIFTKVQSLDWVYLHSLASGSCGIDRILACIGNNMAFRKEVYNKLGGYGGISFSVTEDLALMREIDAVPEYKIKYPINYNCLITTEPCEDLITLIRQKKRWFKGGLDINFLGYITGIEMYLTNILLVTGFLYLNLTLYFILIAGKFLSDLLLMLPVIKIFRLKGLLLYFPFFQLYFALYGLLLPISFIFGRKIVWKGRKF